MRFNIDKLDNDVIEIYLEDNGFYSKGKLGMYIKNNYREFSLNNELHKIAYSVLDDYPSILEYFDLKKSLGVTDNIEFDVVNEIKELMIYKMNSVDDNEIESIYRNKIKILL